VEAVEVKIEKYLGAQKLKQEHFYTLLVNSVHQITGTLLTTFLCKICCPCSMKIFSYLSYFHKKNCPTICVNDASPGVQSFYWANSTSTNKNASPTASSKTYFHFVQAAYASFGRAANPKSGLPKDTAVCSTHRMHDAHAAWLLKCSVSTWR